MAPNGVEPSSIRYVVEKRNPQGLPCDEARLFYS